MTGTAETRYQLNVRRVVAAHLFVESTACASDYNNRCKQQEHVSDSIRQNIHLAKALAKKSPGKSVRQRHFAKATRVCAEN